MSIPKCPRCGAPLRAGAQDPVCPACVLSGALGTPAGGGDLPRGFGGYRLLSLLGSGGMGTVYEAEHLPSGRRVALKMLDRQLASEEIRQRFLREGRLAASINHPHSLYVFGSEEIEGIPVITMEVAPGGTLQDRLDRRGPMPVPEAVDAILDVVDGLDTAHAAGVLHRDVKPSNCFVGPDGAVKIGDFGLSVSTMPGEDSWVTAAGVILGTPAFAPPEQLRGDEVDARADIYSVGATLFALLTASAPFDGENVVQVVANVIDRPPARLSDRREGVPADLARVVDRCLAKLPDERFPDYAALREALLPFGSKRPAPASMHLRTPAAWIDGLIAFLPAYLVLMLLVGADDLLVRPLVERTLHAARFHLLLLGCGVLYFALFEGLAGAGLGKRLKRLRVVRADGRRPGPARALVRIGIPLLCVEGVRWPLALAFVSGSEWSGSGTAMFVGAAIAGGCVPALLGWCAHAKDGYATVWDRASGTRVVSRPKGIVRPAVVPLPRARPVPADAPALGPYRVVGAVEPGAWLDATDPVLRRPVWLLRPDSRGMPAARRNVARPGRLRWLQDVEADGASWHAFEAPAGLPFAALADGGRRLPWTSLRLWLHDLASELWSASRDRTMPASLGLDHVWITADGRAVLLDRPWPGVRSPAAPVPAGDVAGQQRFLGSVADRVDAPGVPLHARPVLRNLGAGSFEKLSYLAGSLRGLLDRSAEVGRGVRAGSLLLLPLYVWAAFVVGRYHDKPWDDAARILVTSGLGVLAAFALIQLLAVPFRCTPGQAIFRLAVVDAAGEPAAPGRLLLRWSLVWLPLLVPFALLAWAGPAAAGAALVPWLGAVLWTGFHPRRGPHDRWAGTWVVRR